MSGSGLKHGTYCWTEIASSDSAKSMEFFKKMFGWNFTTGDIADGGFAYNEYSTGGDRPAGGLYQLTPEMCPPGEEMPPPHFLSYVAVDNVDESAKQAAELGGTILREPMDIPKTGRFAIVKEPSGAVFAIFTPSM